MNREEELYYETITNILKASMIIDGMYTISFEVDDDFNVVSDNGHYGEIWGDYSEFDIISYSEEKEKNGSTFKTMNIKIKNPEIRYICSVDWEATHALLKLDLEYDVTVKIRPLLSYEYFLTICDDNKLLKDFMLESISNQEFDNEIIKLSDNLIEYLKQNKEKEEI